MSNKISPNIKWFTKCGDGAAMENREIIVSSRIRVARNVTDVPFEIKMSKKDAQRLIKLILSVVEKNFKGRYIDLEKITPLERESLLECHIISPAILKQERSAGVYMIDEGMTSIMLNEEDHMRIQGLSCGLNLVNLASAVYEIEEKIGAELSYAFNETYGFVTSCPTNLGTGLRASLLLHLPGLVFTNEVEKVLKGAVQIGMAVRGIFGEGTDIKGNLFQISNQHTLGVKEEDLIETISKLTHMIIDIEMKARDVIMAKARHEFEDKIYRSLAVLRSARMISTDEVLNLLSAVRFGIGMSLIRDVSLEMVNEILVVSRPANIQLFFGEILEEHERDIKRAEYIRQRLSGNGQ
jgi:protein arginine kinase